MWDEINRLKQHVADLQRNERMLIDAANAAADDRDRFVTHPQLQAGLALKASTTAVPTEIGKLRADLLAAIATKADVTLVDAVHLKKLDIATFDAQVRATDKLRFILEQMLRDMFATFALHVERDVRDVQALLDVNEKRILGALTGLESAKHDHSFLCERVRAVERKTGGGQPKNDAGTFFRTDDQTTFQSFEAAVNTLHAESVVANAATAQLSATIATMQAAIDAVHTETSKSEHDIGAAIAAEVRKAHAADAKLFQAIEAKQAELAENVRRAQETAALAVSAVDDFKSDASTILQNTCDKNVAAAVKAMGTETNHLRDLIKRNQYVASEHTKTVEGMVRCTSQALTALEKKLHALGIVCHSTRRDIVEMKAPFLTEVANLKAENNAILHEIRRQQDVSRELVLDYKDYVDQHDANPLKPQKPVSARRPHSSVTPVNLTKRFGVVPDCHVMPPSSVACGRVTKPRAKTAGPNRTSGTVPPSMAVAVAPGRATRRLPPPSTSDDNGDDGHDHCGDLFAVGCIDPVENAFLLSKSPLGYQSNVLENNNTIE
ncbi:hypothetical protein, variant 1 [Aphanomyces astaci]|nr:hypothetical protein, variant 1 [Aphanomyces astaci]ETV75534.1 hypothetical protein, variant 1 [Aphanomyces astaci]|eukprot:XP_009835168.1 hypothetical protein, variant 1 [Aphanomyces astaci]